ncbi:MAG: TVP38/TMEM64 family protein [Candidatus Puniceispirillaceae bacterium]
MTTLSSIKRFILPACLIAGLILFFATGLHQKISFQQLAQSYGEIKLFVTEQRVLALMIFFTVYFLAVAMSLPIASLLTLSGGAIFGWWAALIIIMAATAGAGLVFLAAKSLLRDWLKQKTGAFMQKLETGFRKNGFSYLLALRLIPAAPFWVVNIIPALVGMRFSTFMLATFVGIAPGTLVYVGVAQGFDLILAQGKVPDLSLLKEPKIILPLVALGVMSLLPVALDHLKKKKGAGDENINS